MLTGREPITRSSLWKSRLIKTIAGARMEEAKGVIKVMAERKPTMSHLRRGWKLRGISGSSWVSHPTMPSEKLESRRT
jgi:hypothetical protein